MKILTIIPLFALPTHGQAFKDAVDPLIEASCIECHDSATKTALNFEDLAFDLADADAYRTWEKVFDMVASGEMPPAKKPRPDQSQKKAALASLHRHLRDTSLVKQKTDGRAPARRLTRIEYEYTMHDLLGIGEEAKAKRLLTQADAAFRAGQRREAKRLYGLLHQNYRGTQIYQNNSLRIDHRRHQR